MKRQSGIGIIRPGSDARSGSGASYFQRRVQPPTGTLQSRKPPIPSAENKSASPEDKRALAETKASAPLHGLNAIAVLTNHPNKAPARIHRSDLPTVPRTHYPKIKLSDFEEYLGSTAALFEQYAANASSGYQVAVDELNRYEAAVEDAEKVLEVASHTYSMDSTTMAERLKTLDGPRSEFGLDSISEYGGGAGDGARARMLPGIEDVPTIFFEESFDLRNPTTFDIATQVILGPQTANSGLFALEKMAGTSETMQETLSGYMDVVEAYLTREISRRSPSFFAALSTLEELHAETDKCIEKINLLRNDLKETARVQCAPGLELIRLRRRRDNLAEALHGVELLSSLRHALAAVDELIESGDHIGALNLLIEAQALADPVYKQPRAADKTGLADTAAFQNLSTRMSKALRTVASQAKRELAAIILRDMREFVDDGLSSMPDGLLTEEPGQSRMDIYQANLELQLAPLVYGLARTGNIDNALKAYREGFLSETTNLIESLYPGEFPRSQGHAMFNDASQQRALGAAVRGQTFDQFCALLRQQEHVLLLVLSHGMLVRRVILQVLKQSSETPTTSPLASTPADHAHSAEPDPILQPTRYKAEVQRSLSDTFDELMDIAHIRNAKLLNHRSEQNSRLSLTGFYTLYTLIWQFIVQYESVGEKMCFGLRGTLTAQAKAFLKNFHAEKMRQIQILIENEQWVQAEVPVDFQNLVNRVVDAAVNSSDDSVSNPLSLDPSTAESGPPARTEPNITARAEPGSASRVDSDAASVRSLDTGLGRIHVDGSSFHVVGCSLVLVKTVVEYLQCSTSITALAADVLQRLVELFKMFNSRTCQVVLGAGAMRSAGLKNISAKHLALASESLALCMELLPHVRECLRRAMTPAQSGLLSQLDTACQDFSSHQHELHAKLVAIMAERADHHARMLAATDWDALADVSPPVPAMDALVKEVRKLHKVLRRYLPPSVLRTVFTDIFAMYEPRLTRQYQQLRISSGEGKRQLMLNSQYLLRRLQALEVAPVEWELEVVVNNINLVRSHQPGSPSSASASPDPDPVPDPLSGTSEVLTPSVPPTPISSENPDKQPQK
ncbi:hypothetical protein LPJ78_000281 [Coemansia sp. RSA 989]|nr:Vps54-like protein-domain-containing protein [Coemansia mojavensis]KAJ1868343.1 hypothetical protein LPJ78_000281 [Coemansia sp. RSA 989]KAJ1875544.1 hypothetical protein LPJ55_000537 [Coemansia sp. RSA 990]